MSGRIMEKGENMDIGSLYILKTDRVVKFFFYYVDGITHHVGKKPGYNYNWNVIDSEFPPVGLVSDFDSDDWDYKSDLDNKIKHFSSKKFVKDAAFPL